MELIFFLILLFYSIYLTRRIKKIERSLGLRVSSFEHHDRVSHSSESHSSTAFPPAKSHKPDEPSWFLRFIYWLRDDWLLKLGALLLLIGFGWLTTYAFLNNWIGPMGRIVFGITAGVLILIGGWWRIKKFLHQGGVFLALGSTVILVTVFAAREYYEFFTPATALGIMFLSTVFVALMSVKYRSRSLALASLLLAGVAPLLTNNPSSDHIALFSYLFIVTAGVVWVVSLTGWRVLTTAALAIFTLYSVPHLVNWSIYSDTLLYIAYAFAALLFVTNIFGILKGKQGSPMRSDLVAAGGNGVLLISWIMVAAPEEWQSLIMTLWMLAFGISAFMTFKATQRKEPFFVYAGVSVLMIAAATSVELGGAALVIAFTVEAGVISLLTQFLLRDIKMTERMSLLLVVPALLSLESIGSRAWRNDVVFHQDFFVLLVLFLVMMGLGLFFMHQRELLKKIESSSWIDKFLVVIGSAYAYLLLWLSLHSALIKDDTAAMVALVIYTLIGLTTYFRGGSRDHRLLRIYGAVLLGLVVLRLFLVDIWNMALTGRIATFFLIGALLVTTAFFGREKKS